jgi:hypothetical protein
MILRGGPRRCHRQGGERTVKTEMGRMWEKRLRRVCVVGNNPSVDAEPEASRTQGAVLVL